MIIGTLCVIAAFMAIAAATYLLIPLPLLSYQQGSLQTSQGEVTEIKGIRPGVLQVSLTRGVNIDPALQQGAAVVTQASCTSFVYFRKGQSLPKTGDIISVTSINRLYRFTGRSFNWAKDWSPIQGLVPNCGSVQLVTA